MVNKGRVFPSAFSSKLILTLGINSTLHTLKTQTLLLSNQLIFTTPKHTPPHQTYPKTCLLTPHSTNPLMMLQGGHPIPQHLVSTWINTFSLTQECSALTLSFCWSPPFPLNHMSVEKDLSKHMCVCV